jgi:ABC-type sulfate transport system substrate-binding protein
LIAAGRARWPKLILNFLYTEKGRRWPPIIYRPRLRNHSKKKYQTIPQIKLFSIDEVFAVAKGTGTAFYDGGIFDQIYGVK